MGLSNMFYDVATRGLADGVRGIFGPGSKLMSGGGAKGMVLPDGWEKDVIDFFGVDGLRSSFGMTEVNGFYLNCEHNRFHILPWVTLILLDPDSGKPLPRTGVQTGRACFFDPTNDGTWGGIVSGDKMTVHWDGCPCGRTTPAFENNVQRFSELQGGDDKITCAATASAQTEALEFLTGFEA
jgi:hypothetical protein